MWLGSADTTVALGLPPPDQDRSGFSSEIIGQDRDGCANVFLDLKIHILWARCCLVYSILYELPWDRADFQVNPVHTLLKLTYTCIRAEFPLIAMAHSWYREVCSYALIRGFVVEHIHIHRLHETLYKVSYLWSIVLGIIKLASISLPSYKVSQIVVLISNR